MSAYPYERPEIHDPPHHPRLPARLLALPHLEAHKGRSDVAGRIEGVYLCRLPE